MKKLTAAFLSAVVLTLMSAAGMSAIAQDNGTIDTPETINLEVDESTQLQATVRDAAGNTTGDAFIFFTRDREALTVTPQGEVTAHLPGTWQIIVRTVADRDERISKEITVNVAFPPIREITFAETPGTIYAGTTVPITMSVIDQKNLKRENPDLAFSSSNPGVAQIDRFGRLSAGSAGNAVITAEADGVEATWNVTVQPHPVASIELESNTDNAVTGEVVTFNARTLDASGSEVSDVPVSWSFSSKPDDALGEGATGQVNDEGKFVANKPGLFTVTARSGNVVSDHTIRVDSRNVQREIEVVGHGLISDVHTSDLWVWEGVDGRDYAVTGTWGANGEAYFWDVTDPSNMQIIDTVTVDARTVNDVKVSADGRIAVLTREGASNRRNGIVILDITDPHNVTIHSEYSEGLTGGVHNAFIYEDHVLAVNNGTRYDIIDISDPKNPQTVSRFELDTPGHSIHDVWVEDGIAYSSNWRDGIVAVDVGSTPAAQTPEQHDVGAGSMTNPVKLGSYAYPSGRNHAAFPFKSESTGEFYVIGGDESFPNGINTENEPTVPAGYMHFVKFDGWDQPKEVARYEVPEAGTHNLWVKGDTLYAAYYNAGLRIVDISGELMGNLYDQGREIAKFIPTHHEGRVPNAPMTWGPQPYKGHIFVADWNSGLWALKLVDSPQGTN